MIRFMHFIQLVSGFLGRNFVRRIWFWATLAVSLLLAFVFKMPVVGTIGGAVAGLLIAPFVIVGVAFIICTIYSMSGGHGGLNIRAFVSAIIGLLIIGRILWWLFFRLGVVEPPKYVFVGTPPAGVDVSQQASYVPPSFPPAPPPSGMSMRSFRNNAYPEGCIAVTFNGGRWEWYFFGQGKDTVVVHSPGNGNVDVVLPGQDWRPSGELPTGEYKFCKSAPTPADSMVIWQTRWQ